MFGSSNELDQTYDLHHLARSPSSPDLIMAIVNRLFGLLYNPSLLYLFIYLPGVVLDFSCLLFFFSFLHT